MKKKHVLLVAGIFVVSFSGLAQAGLINRINQMVWGRGTDLISHLNSDFVAVPWERGRYNMTLKGTRDQARRIEQIARKNAINACGGYWNYLSHQIEDRSAPMPRRPSKYEILDKSKLGQVDIESSVSYPYVREPNSYRNFYLNGAAVIGGLVIPSLLLGPLHGLPTSALLLNAYAARVKYPASYLIGAAHASETSEIKFSELRCRKVPKYFAAQDGEPVSSQISQQIQPKAASSLNSWIAPNQTKTSNNSQLAQ